SAPACPEAGIASACRHSTAFIPSFFRYVTRRDDQTVPIPSIISVLIELRTPIRGVVGSRGQQVHRERPCGAIFRVWVITSLCSGVAGGYGIGDSLGCGLLGQ